MVTNTATVTSADSDLNQANNSATVLTTITAPTADVAVSLSASPNPAGVSNNFTYTITVTNNGPGTAFNVVVTEPLGGLNFVSISSLPSITGSNVNGTATCNLGALAPGSSATALLTVVPPQTGAYTNVATVSTASSDPNLNNNSATLAVTAVNPAPNIIAAGATLLSESFSPPNGTIDPGETVTLSFSFTNSGSAATSNVIAYLQPTNGVTLINPLNGSQGYGALVPGGPARSNVFTFSAAGTNGGVLNALFAIQDGPIFLGTATFTFKLPATNAFVSSTGNVLKSGPSQPYPSLINISGLSGEVSKLTVTLSNLTHSFPSDLEMLLVGPEGQDAVLMATAGGAYAITNVNVTFDDAAASTLPHNSQITNNTTAKLSNFTLAAPFPNPAPAAPYGSQLEVFDGTNPNGIWSLYVLDDSASDSGNLGGWSVNIVTVNPVNSAADVGVTLSNPSGPLLVGQNLTYTLNVSNGGPAIATDVTLTETLPSGLGFVATSAGSYSNGPGLLTLNLGSLAVGSNIVCTVTVNPPAQGVYNPTASVSADQADLNTVNNTATVTTTVITVAPAHLSGSGYTSGAFSFTLQGTPGSYVLQASPDLTNWTSISTNTVSSSGTLQLSDPNAGTYQRRYYRVSYIVP